MVRFWCCPFFLLTRSCLGRITIMTTIARHHSRTLRQVLAMVIMVMRACMMHRARLQRNLQLLQLAKMPALGEGGVLLPRFGLLLRASPFTLPTPRHHTWMTARGEYACGLQGISMLSSPRMPCILPLLSSTVVIVWRSGGFSKAWLYWQPSFFMRYVLCLRRASWLLVVGSSFCKGNSALLRLHRHGLRLRLLLCLIWLGAASCLMVH